ncbi:MAG: DNA-3-methyladenine glycosylase [Ruminococcus flavefaciens]|nr:DNA-3-methyladenine glycosylase [Ruminococcus flavefaciens]MCM1229081.1 DNA-3-methyladenine glycosylase [Ruminococcus flavefaciens]
MVLTEKFFHRDAPEVAPELVGKIIVRTLDDGTEIRERIAEVEVYRGEEDKACHASKGRTKRTEILYGESGLIYVYLCYGMHWLMNVITGEKGQPQGILIRCGDVHNGPAKLTKYLQIDGSFNGEKICGNDKIRIEDDGFVAKIKTAPRVGIDYAGEYWRNKKWRYIAEKE